MRVLAERCDGSIVESEGLFMYASASPSPFPWNGAARTAPGLTAQEIDHRASTFFGGIGHGFAIWVLEGLDDDMLADLGEADFTAPEMIIDHPVTTPSLPDDVVIRSVKDQQTRINFLDVVGESFEDLGESRSTWLKCYPTVDSLVNPHSEALVVYQGGEAVAGGMYYRTGEVVEILHIGTRPSFRGRGHGRAVSAALTNHAFEHGVQLASLQATSMGLPIYQQMGYETVSTYHCFLRMSE